MLDKLDKKKNPIAVLTECGRLKSIWWPHFLGGRLDFISAIELSFRQRLSTGVISKMLDRATFLDLVSCLKQGEQNTDAAFLSKTKIYSKQFDS